MKQSRIFWLLVLVFLTPISIVHANIITKGAQEIVEAITKKGSREAIEELTEYGGREAIEEFLERVAKEGGEEVVERTIRYSQKYGIRAIRAIDNAPVAYVNALDELQETLVERALWAVQRESDTVTSLLLKHGPETLEIVARHRGVGSTLLTTFGDEGIEIGQELVEDHVIMVLRYADDIQGLPAQEKTQILNAILEQPAKVLGFLEKHPKVLLATGGVAAVIAYKDDLLGMDTEIVVGDDGMTKIIKKGFIERITTTITQEFQTPILYISMVVAILLLGWGGIKLWGVYRTERQRHKE